MRHRSDPSPQRGSDPLLPAAHFHQSPPSRSPPTARRRYHSVRPRPRRRSEWWHSPAPHIPASQMVRAIPNSRTETYTEIHGSVPPPLLSCTRSGKLPSMSAADHPPAYTLAEDKDLRLVQLRRRVCI